MRNSPLGDGFRPTIISIGIFLVFGSSMAALAGTMLIWPGTVLDRLWLLNETAHVQLREAGTYLGPLFWMLGLILIGTAAGWFMQRLWAFRLTVAILCAQLVGDVVNLFRGDLVRGGIGILIAGSLLLYLLRSRIRSAFQ
ncbi:MAG TPA: hypothetical protein VKB49_30455 [Candidatus Sulfotelmatobacter sp.]|nr:hypothetical protein [Candidatus Sulfotelmatobacter sp.]